jgi:hypothetical protein
MPMQRQLYPDNWDANDESRRASFALSIKAEANWTCENCSRKCKRSGEAWSEFITRIVPKVHCEFSHELLREISEKSTRFVLTVAHLDHVPENCSRDNLKAWCSVCHCRYDLKAMQHKKMLKREHLGQLRLFSKAMFGAEGTTCGK